MIMSDLSELPLKPNKQTFVDVPKSLDAVIIDDLFYDIQQGTIDVNKIHIYEALRIFSQLVHDIMELQSNELLYEQYRKILLEKYLINLSDIPLPLSSITNIDALNFKSSDSIDKVENDEFKTKLDELITSDTFNDTDDDSMFEKIKDKLISRTFSNNFQELNDFQPITNESSPFRQQNIHQDIDAISVVSTDDYNQDNKNNNDDDDDDDDDTISIKLKNKTSQTHNNFETELETQQQQQQEQEQQEQSIIGIEHLIATTSLDPVKFPISDVSKDQIRKDVLKRRSINQTNQLLKLFNLVNIPSLSIDDFLVRLKTYSSSISTTCYIHAASMIFKLTCLFNLVPLSLRNVYRFILASIRCSTKTLEDVYQKQKTFATVGGVSLKDLFKIEVAFLYLIDFRLVTGENMLNDFLKNDFLHLREFMTANFPKLS